MIRLYEVLPPRPVKYSWVVIQVKQPRYMQWALELSRHYLDEWDHYD